MNHGVKVACTRSPVKCGLGIVSGLSPSDATSVRGSVTGKRRSRVRKLLFSVVTLNRGVSISVPACHGITRGFGV